MQIDHLDKQTTDGAQLNLDALYQICPSCFTEAVGEDGKLRHVVDFEKLRALLGDSTVEDAPEVYDFTWVGKRAAQREAMAPCRKTLRPCPEESVNWDTTQNLYIEGDNLEVLKLLQNSYMGKVKMIYIDPPYNTGNDFVYHDDFHRTQREEDEAAGVINEEGERMIKNTESNGKFHSDWCSMIYARLLLARTLLTMDGVVFISIDDNEVDNLRKICDEVFGESNRLDRGEMVWINKGSTKGFNKIVKNHEYILAYGKDANTVYSRFGENRGEELEGLEHYCYNKPSPKNPYNDVRFNKGCRIEGVQNIEFVDHVGDEVQLKIISGRMLFENGILQEDVVLRGTWPYKNQIEHYFLNHDKGIPTFDFKGQKWTEIFFNSKGLPRYRKERNTQIISSVIDESGIPNYGSEDIASLLGKKEIFNFPKPHQLLMHLISYFAGKDALVLDFFSGSATLAHATLKMNAVYGGNRKYIMIQLPELTDKESEAFKAGYKNICEIGKERIRRAGKKIKEGSPLTTMDLDIGFRVFKCDDSNYKEVAFAPKDYSQEALDLFVDNIKEDRTDLDLLFDCMLRWGVTLDLPMTKTKVDGCTIHNVNEGGLVACFDGKVTEAVIDAIAEMYPAKVVFRDSSFEEAASKLNLFELFKQKCGWTEQEVKNNVRVI